jgi:arsenate reductase (thioredoxin)
VTENLNLPLTTKLLFSVILCTEVTMERVLFLCTGNSARSQMAEAILRRYGSDLFEVHSAGLKPWAINPFTYTVMAELGYDLNGQRSKGVDEYLARVLFQYVITVCDDADRNCPTVWLNTTRKLHWSFEDPAAFQGSEEMKLARFREARDLIEKQVLQFLNDVRKQA